MPKHVHAELIKVWADGAIIEGKWGGGWMEVEKPSWDPIFKYRVKPEPKPDVVYYYLATYSKETQKVSLAQM